MDASHQFVVYLFSSFVLCYNANNLYRLYPFVQANDDVVGKITKVVTKIAPFKVSLNIVFGNNSSVV